jgi:DNA-directed RNA polymerase specialized sigma24 family protein
LPNGRIGPQRYGETQRASSDNTVPAASNSSIVSALSDTAFHRKRVVALADQLTRLKPQYRDVIVFRNLHGLSFEESAVRTDRNAGAVRMLWLRAMEKLKQVCEPIE